MLIYQLSVFACWDQCKCLYSGNPTGHVSLDKFSYSYCSPSLLTIYMYRFSMSSIKAFWMFIIMWSFLYIYMCMYMFVLETQEMLCMPSWGLFCPRKLPSLKLISKLCNIYDFESLKFHVGTWWAKELVPSAWNSCADIPLGGLEGQGVASPLSVFAGNTHPLTLFANLSLFLLSAFPDNYK